MRRIYSYGSILLTVALALAQSPALELRGDRFTPLAYDQLTPEQKTIADRVLSGEIQGGTGGPFNVLLRSPSVADSVLRWGEYERFKSPLPDKLKELAVLVTTRYWTAQFPWYAHRRAAEQAGLDAAIIAAIREGRPPEAMDASETAVYNFSAQLLKDSEVSDETFAAAKEVLSEGGVVELMGAMAYYGTVGMLVNTDRYPMPEGVGEELRRMENPLP